MRDRFSNMDLMPGPDLYTAPESNYFPPQPQRKSKRFVVFIVTFLSALILSEIYVFSRPAIYQSRATLLTVAKPSLDETTIEADIQHVAIQQGLLTSTPLLTEISERLNRFEAKSGLTPLTVNEIRNAVSVIPIEATHLVNLRAEGSEPAILQNLVTTWIEVYQDARETEVRKSKEHSSGALRDEAQGLEKKIEEKRQFLDNYRETYDIVSMEREENQILSRLKGLNSSLNTASEDVIKAQAEHDAIKQAIADGKPVVPESEKNSLSTLELRAQELREKVAEIRRQYTADYVKLQPALKVIPEKLKALEKKIRIRLDIGKKYVLSESQNTRAAAIQRVNTLQTQLNEFEDKAAEFSALLSKHNALEEELAGLQEIYRETKERLVKLEVKQYEKYPQVDVVEWANLPHEPIRPLYLKDAIIALVGALILGLISVWFFEFLSPQAEITNSPITLSGVHVYAKPNAEKLTTPSIPPTIEQQPIAALTTPFPRELTSGEVLSLIGNSNEKGRHLIFLLFSGLTTDEAAALSENDINVNDEVICVPGDHTRVLPLTQFLKIIIQQSNAFPTWSTDTSLESSEDLSALITCIAIDAGLTKPQEINAEALRHTFIIFLVRQGLRLSELAQIVGPLPSALVASYGHYSPAGPGISTRDINFEYPGFNLQKPMDMN